MKKDVGFVTWVMFTACNANCENCFQKNMRDEGVDDLNHQNLLTKAEKIKDLMILKKLNFIEIYGGEYTLLPNKIILEILEILFKVPNITVKLYSNYTADNNYYINMLNLKIDKEQNLTLVLSYHNNIFKIKEYINKIKTLYYFVKSKKNSNILLMTEIVNYKALNKDNISFIKEFYKQHFEENYLKLFIENYEMFYKNKKGYYKSEYYSNRFETCYRCSIRKGGFYVFKNVITIGCSFLKNIVTKDFLNEDIEQIVKNIENIKCFENLNLEEDFIINKEKPIQKKFLIEEALKELKTDE